MNWKENDEADEQKQFLTFDIFDFPIFFSPSSSDVELRKNDKDVERICSALRFVDVAQRYGRSNRERFSAEDEGSGGVR